jgi:hypothetical protein
MKSKGQRAACATGLLLAALMMMALPSATAAEGAQAGLRPRVPVTAVQTTTHTAANGFDWLAKADAAPVAPTRVRQQVGRGSYICSPAGFGRKSRCYSN